jgi:hypothetical protein
MDFPGAEMMLLSSLIWGNGEREKTKREESKNAWLKLSLKKLA